MNDKHEKFWVVWRESAAAPPANRHSHKEDAITEANRLANLSGDPYYVLEVIGVVKPIPIPYDFTQI